MGCINRNRQNGTWVEVVADHVCIGAVWIEVLHHPHAKADSAYLALAYHLVQYRAFQANYAKAIPALE